MNELLSKSWRSLALRGFISLVFGILAAFWPGITLLWLLVMFAAYALIQGVASAVAAVQNRKTNGDWWLMLLWGLVGIGAGVIAFMLPNLTAVVLVLVIGATALGSGIVDMVMSVRLRKVIRGEVLLFLNGLISVAFGVFVFFFPGAGALALVWLIAMYAIVSGLLLLALAWRAKKWGTDYEEWPHGLTHKSL
ncbi:uncharacterized membrane protein HdeD (DUF308 family) [Nitrosospira multiformis]|jgi:uncharacterized membrane protein HdeD (DUF308 family)|uniref:Uncharacterized membrane protein HdeD (DUF308 family) n=1 Tax=Nitrosospira multiformis TaxID=1231 RepID=A0A2T5ICF7_9PROT|nr:HdeD family acid-resistance protein [Nitrosospira multiformis]PTQ81510.1 uncharacterized membrane protein HdeD (DUF308 family) [Nitrosospira multiformis]